MLAYLLLVQCPVKRKNPVKAADDQRCADHDEQSDKPPGFVSVG